MDRELTITPILLNHQPRPGATSWVKLLQYQPADTQIIATRGQMYAVLSLASKGEIDFTPLMSMIIENLQQKYFDQPQGGILQALESTLDTIHKQLLLAGQQDKRLSGGFNFDILVAVNWGTVLYLGQLGSSRACLVREGKIHDIDEGDQPTAGTFLSSGVVQAGDRLLLATSQLLAKFDRQKILHQLSLQPDMIGQSLEQQLDLGPNSLESGIILLVDIKQVPSAEEEGLHILDADTGASARLRSAANKASKFGGSAGGGVKKFVNKLWHWHIADKVPALPLIIILLCLGLLGGSILWKQSPGGKSESVDVSPTVSQMQDLLDQAEQLSTINPDRAADLINQMEPTLSKSIEQSDDGRLLGIQTQRQQLQDQLLNVQTLTPHPLATTSNKPVEPKLVVSGQDVYFIASEGQLMRFRGQSVQTAATNANLYTPTAKLMATTAGLVTADGGKVTPLTTSNTGGSSSDLPEGSSLAASNYQQNAYVLTSSGQLYRYVNQGGQLGNRSTYFPSAIEAEGAVDIAIDGAIYVLRKDGKVDKYLSGRPQAFTLERPALAANARAIFTSEQTDYIYILTDHHILSWDKSGQYKGQYRLSGNATWDAAAVDATGQKLYILSEGKLAEVELPTGG